MLTTGFKCGILLNREWTIAILGGKVGVKSTDGTTVREMRDLYSGLVDKVALVLVQGEGEKDEREGSRLTSAPELHRSN